jgi:DMSO/TMAO reductase YedYZ molybdopterin-dependent catalytic subunit
MNESTMAEQRKQMTASGPENSETPLGDIRSWVTPNRLYFVRNHFEVPALDAARWQLSVTGCVARPQTWTWDELTSLRERTVFATLECAGNGRSFLQKWVPGVPWGAGAIGHAEWTGIPLRLVLETAGLLPGAREVVFEGFDQGSEPDHPETMAFARSLPLAKALDADTLLAFRMNGELLEPSHGYPLRLIVPGWYGVASVKWLRRIEVVDRPFHGYFQSAKYNVKRQSPSGKEETVIVGPMSVKSEIVRPRESECLGIGTNRMFGLAWAGEEAVAGVDISCDGGRSWTTAELIGPQAPYSWTMWEYLWEVAAPGDYVLLARARSAGGQLQALTHDPLNGGYLIHFCRPRPVRVAAARTIQDQRASDDMLVYDMNAYAEENFRFPLDVNLVFMSGEGI